MIVDIESGCFGDDGSIDFIKSAYDKEVDAHSNHPGSYTFEKMYSGHYFGEICRLVYLRLMNEGLLFKQKPVVFPRQWQLKSAMLSPMNLYV